MRSHAAGPHAEQPTAANLEFGTGAIVFQWRHGPVRVARAGRLPRGEKVLKAVSLYSDGVQWNYSLDELGQP